MNLITGMKLKVKFPVFSGIFPDSVFQYNVICEILITKEKYTPSGQHSFTFEILKSDNSSDFIVGSVRRKMGRNLYPNVIEILFEPDNFQELAKEKNKRGFQNRNKNNAINFFAKHGYFPE